MKITNQVVLVTGANRGLGRSLVIASLAAGARKVYVGARDVAKLAPFSGIAADRIVPLALDITDPASLAAAAARASDLTLLINNAGVLASFNALTSTPAQIALDFEVNVFGTLASIKAFLPALERAGAAGGAALVNVLSVVSLASMPALGTYSASKAAAYSITQALRGELEAKHISVHAALPGAIDTDMVRAMEMPKTSPDAVAAGILEGVERGLDEILPDPMSRELYGIWQRDPKALARQLAGLSG